MSDSNVEREVMKHIRFRIADDGNVLLDRGSFDYLIEQAGRAQDLVTENIEIRKGYQERSKRVQELESLIKTHAPEGRNYTNEQYVGLLRDFSRLEETLNFYADKDNYSHGYHDLLGELESDVGMDEGDKARNALRGV